VGGRGDEVLRGRWGTGGFSVVPREIDRCGIGWGGDTVVFLVGVGGGGFGVKGMRGLDEALPFFRSLVGVMFAFIIFLENEFWGFGRWEGWGGCL